MNGQSKKRFTHIHILTRDLKAWEKFCTEGVSSPEEQRLKIMNGDSIVLRRGGQTWERQYVSGGVALKLVLV